MNLATIELGELLKCAAAIFISGAQERERYKHFVGVEARITPVKERHLRVLNRFDHGLRDELYLVWNACKVLRGIEDEGSARSEEFA